MLLTNPRTAYVDYFIKKQNKQKNSHHVFAWKWFSRVLVFINKNTVTVLLLNTRNVGGTEEKVENHKPIAE